MDGAMIGADVLTHRYHTWPLDPSGDSRPVRADEHHAARAQWLYSSDLHTGTEPIAPHVLEYAEHVLAGAYARLAAMRGWRVAQYANALGLLALGRSIVEDCGAHQLTLPDVMSMHDKIRHLEEVLDVGTSCALEIFASEVSLLALRLPAPRARRVPTDDELDALARCLLGPLGVAALDAPEAAPAARA